jgi:3-hydroxy-9,10-secoandrosta-1,3,5(10)-triene-9,17-dione monooxygenase reductase component
LSLDPAIFRTVLGHFASGVVVVTAMAGEEPAGFTCQSFFSLSLDPPLVALAPSKASTSWPKVERSGRLCANVLAEDQEALARSFADSGSDKFAAVGWSAGACGAPRLKGSLAWVECSIEEVHSAGDHYLVVARVTDLEAAPGRPLIFYRGGFGSFEA